MSENLQNKPLIAALSGKKAPKIPIWFMRQAGRYLPDYMAVKREVGSFVKMCLTPKIAAEISLIPLNLLDLDAIILFSDILIPLLALGVDVQYGTGQGIMLGKYGVDYDLASLSQHRQTTIYEQTLNSVYRAVELLAKAQKNSYANKTLLGFAGGPWTVLCYLLHGSSGDANFLGAKRFFYENPVIFYELLHLLTEVTIEYLLGQVAAGVEVVQIFESAAGIVGPEFFEELVEKPTQKIVAALKKVYPNLKIIGFPRGSGLLYPNFVRNTGVDVISLDSNLSLEWIQQQMPPPIVLQGNIDNTLLTIDLQSAEQQQRLTKQVQALVRALQGSDNKQRNFIFNAGHGLLPQTNIDTLRFVIKTVRNCRDK